MKRSVAIVAFVVAVIVASLSAGGHTEAQDGAEGTIAALQTRVAELEATVEARGDKINAQRTQIADLRGDESDSDAPTPEPASGGGESVYLGGNALGLLPDGEAGQLGVVKVGTYDGNILPIVIRNNTDDDLGRLSVSAAARSSDGELIAAGGDQGLNPTVIKPGEYALGYVYFDGIELPADAEFEFDVNGERFTGIDSFSSVDLRVSDAAFLGDRIVGEFENDSGEAVSGPLGISIVCFDSAGEILGFENGFADKQEAAPGDSIPFQVSLFGGVDCTNFLIAGSGWNF